MAMGRMGKRRKRLGLADQFVNEVEGGQGEKGMSLND